MPTALPSSSTPKREDLRKKPLEYARRTRSPVKPSKPPRLKREATLQAGLAIEKSLLSIAESTPSTLERRFRTGIAMRPYQAEDAAKICEREADVRRPGYSGPIGFILGYHMGLGKTAVALHVAQSRGGSTLVVCPGGGLTDHWIREIAKFTDLRVFEAHGKYTKEDLEAADIVLISYSRLMRRYSKLVDYWEQQEEVARLSNLPLPDRRNPTKEKMTHLEELGCTVYLIMWDRIFGDEGHLMRNPEAKSLAAFHALLTWFVVIITATPAQNSLRDFYAYLRLLRVKYMNLEDLEHFDRYITKPLSGTDKRLIANATRMLQDVLEKVMQYRPPCTSDGRMLLRLPSKYRHDIVVTLNSVERAVYNYIIEYLLPKSLIGIYAALIRARQVCDQMQLLAGALPPTSDIPVDDEFLDSPLSVRDPPLDPDPTSDEMRASFDDLADLSIPTHLTSDRPLISAERFPSQLPQSVKDIFSHPEIPYTSSKFQAVYDILENRIPVEEKVIIFSHFARTLHMLAAGLEHRYGQYFDYTLYTGAMSREERRAALNCISSKRGPRPCRVILVSIGAGGSGLNITACNHVILMEPWWNPYVEEQAISRAYRSGQNRNVHTYHLVVQDSIEENIVTRQTEKRTIIGNFMSLCAIPDVPEMHDWIKLTRWKLRDVE